MTAFVGVAGDFNPLLIDETYARTTTFGGPVVPGTLIAAVAVGLGSLDVPLPATAGMVGMTWRFQHPVRPGDSLHTVWRLSRKRPVENPSVGLCFWQVEVINQQNTLVALGEVGRLVSRRGPSEVSSDGAEPATATAPSRSRRRRGRRSSGDKDRVAEVVESQPLPEPANADVPPPARRRRRRRGNGGGNGNGNGQPASGARTEPEPARPASPAPPTAPTAAAAPSASRLRGVLRRLRGT